MNLLILGKALTISPGLRNPDYRGTARPWPYYEDSLPESDEHNQLFLWHLSIRAPNGPVTDSRYLGKLRRFVELLNRHSPESEYELIEVERPEDRVELGREFLGVDISCNFNDSWLDGWRSPRAQSEPMDDPLSDAEKRFNDEIYPIFEPQLNEHGLFRDVRTADDCRQRLDLLQKEFPGAMEFGMHEPIVVYTVAAG